MFYQVNHTRISVCRESFTKCRIHNTSSHDKCCNLVPRFHSLNPGNEVEDICSKISISFSANYWTWRIRPQASSLRATASSQFSHGKGPRITYWLFIGLIQRSKNIPFNQCNLTKTVTVICFCRCLEKQPENLTALMALAVSYTNESMQAQVKPNVFLMMLLFPETDWRDKWGLIGGDFDWLVGATVSHSFCIFFYLSVCNRLCNLRFSRIKTCTK